MFRNRSKGALPASRWQSGSARSVGSVGFRREALAARIWRFDLTEIARQSRHRIHSQEAVQLRGDALGPGRHIFVTQYQNLLSRETVEESDQVFGIEPAREIGMGTRVAELGCQIPLALLFERQRSFKSLALQPILPRPQIVGI